MRLFTFCLLAAIPVAAQTQHLSLGLTGGVPLEKLSSAYGSNDESRRYTFGITAELSLNDHVSVNINPLYKHSGSRSDFYTTIQPGQGAPPQITSYSGRMRSASLELPVIGKYTFRNASQRVRPFAGAGFALMQAWQKTNSIGLTGGSMPTLMRYSIDRRLPFDTGAVVSGGVNLKYRRFTIAPEMRYTRWGNGAGGSRNRNQAEALISFRL